MPSHTREKSGRSPTVRRGAAVSDRRLVLAAQRGERGARAELIVMFRPLIASVARTYRRVESVEHAELMQAGTLGLLQALVRYDAHGDTPFGAYGWWWIRQAMQQLVSELTYSVILPDRALQALARLKRTHGDYIQRHGREPTWCQLAAAADVERSQLDDLIAAVRSPHGLDEPISGAEGVVGTVADLVPDPNAEDAYDQVSHRLSIEQLPSLLEGLSDRERAVLESRFGLGGPQRTLREVADVLALSPERIRQIEQRALGRLRQALDPGDADESRSESAARTGSN